MRRILLISALLATMGAALALSTVTGARGPTRLGVTLTEFKVSMASTSVPAGVPVTFAVTNQGQTMHELVLEKAGANDEPLEVNGRETEIQDIAPGETKSATWTITEPGEYQLACHVPGHFDAGMVERFTVTAAGGRGYGQVGAAMQPAAPSGEDQAESGNPPAGGADMLMRVAASATTPATRGAGSSSLLWWAAAAVLAETVAIYGAFRLIVSQIRVRE